MFNALEFVHTGLGHVNVPDHKIAEYAEYVRSVIEYLSRNVLGDSASIVAIEQETDRFGNLRLVYSAASWESDHHISPGEITRCKRSFSSRKGLMMSDIVGYLEAEVPRELLFGQHNRLWMIVVSNNVDYLIEEKRYKTVGEVRFTFELEVRNNNRRT